MLKKLFANKHRWKADFKLFLSKCRGYKIGWHEEIKVLRYIIRNCEHDDFYGRYYSIGHSEEYEAHHPVWYDEDGIMMLRTISPQFSIVNKLIADGCLLPGKRESSGEKEWTVYELTDKGKYFFENRRDQHRAFWKSMFSSFLPGLISGIAVTLVTTWLTGLLKLTP